MVEKADACGNPVHACTIQVQRNLDPGLVGGALQASLARGSVGKSVHVPVLAGRRRRRQRPMKPLWTVRPKARAADCPIARAYRCRLVLQAVSIGLSAPFPVTAASA